MNWNAPRYSALDAKLRMNYALEYIAHTAMLHRDRLHSNRNFWLSLSRERMKFLRNFTLRKSTWYEIWLLFVERNLSLKQKKIFKFFFFHIKEKKLKFRQIYLDSNFVQFILQKVRNEAIFLVFRFFVLQSKVSARKKFKIEIPAEEEIKIQTKTLHSFNPIKWILPRINNRKNHTFETLVIIMPILLSLHLTKSQWN